MRRGTNTSTAFLNQGGRPGEPPPITKPRLESGQPDSIHNDVAIRNPA